MDESMQEKHLKHLRVPHDEQCDVQWSELALASTSLNQIEVEKLSLLSLIHQDQESKKIGKMVQHNNDLKMTSMIFLYFLAPKSIYIYNIFFPGIAQ